MKKIYRSTNALNYWENRWEKAGVDKTEFVNQNMYPIKYSDKVIANAKDILECGCGSGRLYFHYKKKFPNKAIKAFDYSQNAVNNILAETKTDDVIVASITDLPYEDNSFDCLMAFGVLHSLQMKDIKKSFSEISRVLKKDGRIVFSVRANTLENDIIENIEKNRYRKKHGHKSFDQFHKWQFDLDDIMKLCRKDGLVIENYYYARNVSFLFKFNFCRHKKMKEGSFNESYARSNGFRLNFFWDKVDKLLNRCFPEVFSNVLVIVAKKR